MKELGKVRVPVTVELLYGISGSEHVEICLYCGTCTAEIFTTWKEIVCIRMIGITASKAVVGIQIGYCVSDIISKCGMGLVIYPVT